MEILEQSKIVHLDEKALLNSFLFWLLQLQITGMILIADRIYDALKVKRFFTMLCISPTCIKIHDVSVIAMFSSRADPVLGLNRYSILLPWLG